MMPGVSIESIQTMPQTHIYHFDWWLAEDVMERIKQLVLQLDGVVMVDTGKDYLAITYRALPDQDDERRVILAIREGTHWKRGPATDRWTAPSITASAYYRKLQSAQKSAK